ncbi:MAG: hypothetical protein GY950_00690 [bacterium]|nr:hypothetical protein [bacterium]
MNDAKWFIWLDCCRSGNCVECMGLKVGVTTRVLWSERPCDKPFAENVAKKFIDFNPNIVDTLKKKG